jgi:hypothetical protein
MSADSLLRYLADQTQYYQGEARAEETRQQAQQAAQNQTILAQMAEGKRASEAEDVRRKAAQAESEKYSEAKLQEQRGMGLAATGNVYSDARLREQLGMPAAGAQPSHPLENYLGAVQSQDQYRPAMMQYLAAGGKRPKWFTGNFEIDKPQIEAAIAATMTPKEQAIRQETKQRMLDLEEARTARIDLAKEVEARRAQEAAQKREGIKAKAAIPNRDDRLQALQVLGGLVGAGFSQMPINAQDAAAAKAASIAKAKMGTPEAQGVDFESLLSDAYNEMILNGELKLPQEGTGLRGWFGVGQPEQTAGFKPRGAEPPAAPASSSEKPAPSAPVKVQSRADYDSLPVGSLYVHPNGKTYRKK